MGTVKFRAFALYCCIGSILVFTSCVQQKHFFRSNQINYIKPAVPADPDNPQPGDTRADDTLIAFKMHKGFQASIQEKEGHLVLKPDSKFNMADSSRTIFKTPIVITDDLSRQIAFISSVAQLRGKYFVPQVIYDSLPPGKICFFDSKPVLQTLTIPVKFRPKLTYPAPRGSSSSQVETGVNVGVALWLEVQPQFLQAACQRLWQQGQQSFIDTRSVL